MQKEKRSKGLVKTVLDKASFSVGFLCAKTAKMGDVAKGKSWKKTVSASKDLMGKAGEKTSAFIHDAKEGASLMKVSFMSGFESAKEGTSGPKAKIDHAAGKEIKKKKGAKTEAKIKKKLSPQEKQKKMKDLSEAPADTDIEKEIKKIDEEVVDVN